MCPEPQILSVYMDGELPSPWKEKMETHLTECSKCREKITSFSHVKELFKKETSQKRTYVETAEASTEKFELTGHELMDKAKERVWRKLESGRRVRYGLVRQNEYNSNLWKNRISIPIPVAAAAAVVIAIFASVIGLRGGSANNNVIAYQGANYAEDTNFILAAEEKMTGIIPTTGDLNSVLQYLGIEHPEVIVIQLPDNGNFSRSGEPAMIRAADYRGHP